MGIDCSMIRNVRVPHEQFVAIKNKAKYLIVEDRDKGGCVCFDRAEEINVEESQRILKETLEELNITKERMEESNKIIDSLNIKITNGIW